MSEVRSSSFVHKNRFHGQYGCDVRVPMAQKFFNFRYHATHDCDYFIIAQVKQYIYCNNCNSSELSWPSGAFIWPLGAGRVAAGCRLVVNTVLQYMSMTFQSTDYIHTWLSLNLKCVIE